LGIDPGTRVLGYGVVAVGDRQAVQYLECGVITSKHRAMEQRLAEIAQSLTDVMREYAPQAVAVEDVFTHKNMRSALALAQARGVVLAVAGLAGLPVFSYSPAMVKRAVTGRGRAPKEQVSRMVQSLVGLSRPPSTDATDALAIAITHAHLRPLPTESIQAKKSC